MFMIAVLLASKVAAGRTEIDLRCKAKNHRLLAEQDMTPQKIFNFARANGLKTVEDVHCCMPRDYKRHVAIMHSSIAAQDGDPHGPRILASAKLDRGPDQLPPPFKLIISLNGGRPDQNQRNNIEMLYNNPSGTGVEAYDLELNGRKPHLSGKNPETCVSCHGTDGKVGPGGLQTIFENVDQWTRAVQGTHACNNEEKLNRALERTVARTIDENPRYKCFDKQYIREHHLRGKSTSVPRDLVALDLSLRQIDARRYSQVIAQSKDYRRFKYSIIGALTCINDSEDDGLFPKNLSLSHWFPVAVSQKMMNTSTISAALLKSEKPLETARSILQGSAFELERSEAKLPAVVKALDSGANPAFDVYRGPLTQCNGRADIDRVLSGLRDSLSGDKFLDLYRIDSLIQGFRGESINPLFRFVLESRGVRADDGIMSPTAGSYSTTPTLLVPFLLKREPAGSPLGRWFKRLADEGYMVGQDGRVKDRNTPAGIALFKSFCQQLQTLSYGAFNSDSGVPPPADPVGTSQ